MSKNNTQTEESVSTETSQKGSGSKLLRFDDNNTVTKVKPGKDINNKITALDTDLEHLRSELATINNSVEEGLDRLGDTDTDLTAKVSETYKRLGEIDNAYKSLLDISSRIDNDIQTLNGDVSHVAEQSASGIRSLEQTTIAQSHEFVQKNQRVASRVDQLVESSKLTSELLNQKIKSTTESMLQIEKSVINEIEMLSGATKDKTDSIENSVESNKAKILKLQSVDEAIIRRATTLEISSAELTFSSQRMDANIAQLQKSSETLFTGVSELKARTDELEALTADHGLVINSLQKAASDIVDKVSLLTDSETKHFSIVSVSLFLLLVVVAVLYFTQQNQFSLNDARYVERSENIDNQLSSMQHEQVSANVVTSDSLADLENRIVQVQAAVQDELKKEIASVQDQVQSVEGRFNQTAPFSQIGNDNVLHGEGWIMALPKEHYIVQLAYVDNKDALFEVAQRYNFYLKDPLSYFSLNDAAAEKYVLLSGSYATQQQAKKALQAMPGYIDMQRPQIRKLGEIQSYIAN